MNTGIGMIGQALTTDGQHKTPAVTNGKVNCSGTSKKAVVTDFPASAAEVAESLSQNIADTKQTVERILKSSDDILMGRTLQFSVSQELGKVVIKVIDSSTNKVVREIPSEDMQKLAANLRDAAGVIFDQNA